MTNEEIRKKFDEVQKILDSLQDRLRGLVALDYQDLWELRFSEAKADRCAYRDTCPIHARTIAKRGKQPVQLTLNF